MTGSSVDRRDIPLAPVTDKVNVLARVASVCLEQDGNVWRLVNGEVGLRFDLDSYNYSIFVPKTGEIVIDNATMAGNRWAPSLRCGAPCSQAWMRVNDAAGQGVRVTFTITFKHTAAPEYFFSYTLYDGDGAIRMGFGMKNTREFGIQLMTSEPLSAGELKLAMDAPLTLNGGAGSEETLVQQGLTRESANSLMLTGLVSGRRRTIVWGGLANRDFGKWASIGPKSKKQLSVILLVVKADDPVGRLVDPGQSYWAEDTFYLDVSTDDPFLAMEKYGRAMRIANNAKPKVYDFPVLCGWSVGHLSKLPNVNNSKLLMDELDAANACGLTKYTRVGIRLEPDKYLEDTEQGWWDDEHWAKFGHLVPPYETMAKFCEAIVQRNGIPYTYFQVGMPSDDYARAFPGHMLNNDISRLAVRHPHHKPLVSYDYTDPEFSKRTLAMWRRLRKDGMCGIKFDYPETGWRPEGGFEDRHATAAFAYREVFRLAREGLGPDVFLDERNLGESGRPCLDVTAGLIDTQRNWTDSNAYVSRMVTIGGLRWYKSRTVFNYFPDTKTVHDLSPELRRSMLTMMCLTSGRLDMATSFTLFTPEIIHDFSRIYPSYREPFSARPLDAFTLLRQNAPRLPPLLEQVGETGAAGMNDHGYAGFRKDTPPIGAGSFTGVQDPQVYDLELTPDWHQVALFNSGSSTSMLTVPLSGDRISAGAIGLDKSSEYYVYDFWADSLVGKLSGTARIERELEPLHCAMFSVRKVQPNPQVLSTNRHVLQGWVDLSEVKWDAAARTLSGKAKIIAGEPFRIVIAENGAKAKGASADGAAVRVEKHPAGAGYISLVLERSDSCETPWTISF